MSVIYDAVSYLFHDEWALGTSSDSQIKWEPLLIPDLHIRLYHVISICDKTALKNIKNHPLGQLIYSERIWDACDLFSISVTSNEVLLKVSALHMTVPFFPLSTLIQQQVAWKKWSCYCWIKKGRKLFIKQKQPRNRTFKLQTYITFVYIIINYTKLTVYIG